LAAQRYIARNDIFPPAAKRFAQEDNVQMDRRRVQRITLNSPGHGSLGGHPVEIVDVSTGGFAVMHTMPLATGRRLRMECELGDQKISVTCQIVRCRLMGRTLDGASLYCSGLHVCDIDTESLRRAVLSLVTAEVEARQQALAAAV
jgi:hypothetical protein